MMILDDPETGRVYALMQVLQMPPDMEIIGLGIYSADHDFNKTRKPLKFVPMNRNSNYNELLEMETTRLLEKFNRAPTHEEMQAHFKDSHKHLMGNPLGEAIDPPSDIDWSQIKFPDDFEEDFKTLFEEASQTQRTHSAIFNHPPVMM